MPRPFASRLAILPLLWGVAFGTSAIAADDPDGLTFFRSKVEPILAGHCYGCHAHDGKTKGGLALDTKSGREQGGDSGPAVVPGDPGASLLIQAVRQVEPDLKMPPKGKLNDADIAVLTDWVKRGAPAPAPAAATATRDWWAIRPLQPPAIPAVANPARAINPIDRFLLARLEPDGLGFSPEADRRALIRRVTFDLHGLPPTPEEVHAFVDDPRPDAYERLVDRLLASPRYGERLARLWLDVAHYGESDGFGMDRPRMNAWPYRDYLIRRFNEDAPYARLVQEQIAADALFPEEPELIPALGFLAAGPFNQSALVEQVDGTLCKKIALNLDRDDMVSSVAGTFLSVTLHCARCHDHKFDPITMRDYYQMQAVFAGLVRGERSYDPDGATARERARWQGILAKLEAGTGLDALEAADRDALAADIPRAESELLSAEARWTPLAVTALADSGVATTKLTDGSIRFEGKAADKDTYLVVGATDLDRVAALRVEVLADDTLPKRGPGRSPSNGNFHLSEIHVAAAPRKTPESVAAVAIRSAVSDHDQPGWEVARAIDRKVETAWGIDPKEGQSHQAVFVFDKPLVHPEGSLLTIRMAQQHGGQHLIGRLRIGVSREEPSADRPVSPDLLAILRDGARSVRSAEARNVLAAVAARRRLAALPPRKTAFAVGGEIPPLRNYKPPKTPYPIHILRRGDVTRPLEEVPPGAIAAVPGPEARFELSAPQDETSRRAALARWMTDPTNPLPWRSFANRLWLWHFDRGLAEFPNDFGRMGAAPTHPELLDWLACEVRDGGSLKRFQRLIVTSAAYRQGSGLDPKAAALDGDNRRLWRQNRRRLDAEQIRDAILAVSDRLDPAMGGPSAMQFVYADPNPNVVPRVDYESFDPDTPSSRRRSVYRFLFRNVSDPLLEAFDAANPSLSTPRRAATITPLQALSLFNSRFVLRHCEHLADRLTREAPDLPSRIGRAYELLYARPPRPDEAAMVARHAAEHGLAATCRVLLNTNEFLFFP